MDAVKKEFCAAANWTWYMYPMLSHGAVECLLAHGTKELKDRSASFPPLLDVPTMPLPPLSLPMSGEKKATSYR